MIRRTTPSQTPLFPAQQLSRKGPRSAETPRCFFGDSQQGVFGRLTGVLAAAFPESAAEAKRIDCELKQAGYYQTHAHRSLSAIRYAGMMLSIVLFGIALLFASKIWEPWCVGGLAAATFAAWLLPVRVLRRRANRRRAEIERSLPEILDLIEQDSRETMQLPALLASVSSNLQSGFPAVAQELAFIGRQAELSSLEEALDSFADRIDTPAVHSFAARLNRPAPGRM